VVDNSSVLPDINTLPDILIHDIILKLWNTGTFVAATANWFIYISKSFISSLVVKLFKDTYYFERKWKRKVWTSNSYMASYILLTSRAQRIYEDLLYLPITVHNFEESSLSRHLMQDFTAIVHNRAKSLLTKWIETTVNWIYHVIFLTQSVLQLQWYLGI
jgi:hypothetical protein